jgi:hypothetical protein
LPTAIVWIRVISPTISNGIGRHQRLDHDLILYLIADLKLPADRILGQRVEL